MGFRPSSKLLQACRITLFTRANCSLCTTAKQALSEVWDARPFLYTEIDVMKPDQKRWRDVYEFDTPVIHISKADNGEEQVGMAAKAVKLMHRFKPEDVHKKLDIVEQGSTVI